MKVNKVVPSLHRLLFGPRLNADAPPNKHWPFVMQRTQSALSELFMALYFSFPFDVPCWELPLQACPRLDFPLWFENP